MKCLLLDIEMPIGKVCPSTYNEDGFKCYERCGCADNPELINEKVKNWEKLKKGGGDGDGEGESELGGKKDGLELEKIGTRTVCGTYIIEGNLAYIEQEEEGKVSVVTGGIREIVPINDLDKFIKTRDMHSDIREELEILASKILKK
jgi:hypothetical protein